jgi:hypothetical protein
MPMGDFVPLIAALVVAAVVYALRERQRRRTRINPARPDLTMEQAWDGWRAPAGFEPSPAVLAQAKQSLLETERALADAGGMESMRRETLRSATTALYMETILELPEAERKVLLKGYEEGMEPLVRNVIGVSAVRWRVLREYGRLKYDDAAPEDWFDQYIEVAAPYIREKVRMAREFLVELNEGARRVAEVYDELLRDLETRLLKSPRKKRFVPPDLRTAAEPLVGRPRDAG